MKGVQLKNDLRPAGRGMAKAGQVDLVLSIYDRPG